MRSPVKGLKLVAEVQTGGDVEPIMIKADDPKYFIVIFRGRRDELITVLDAVYKSNGRDYLKKTIIPSPHPELLEVLLLKGTGENVKHLGLMEINGYGAMMKCADIVLKTPAMAVLSIVFDTLTGTGQLAIAGVDTVFPSLFMEMRGICGSLNIRSASVISTPGKKIIEAIL